MSQLIGQTPLDVVVVLTRFVLTVLTHGFVPLTLTQARTFYTSIIRVTYPQRVW